VSHTVLAAVVSGAIGLAASPALARLVPTVPDRENRRWWRGAPVSRRRQALTAIIAAVLGALAGIGAGWGAVLPALIVFAVLATPLVIIDIELHRLPDRLVLPAAVSALVLLAVAASVQSDWHSYLRAVEGGAAVFAVLFAIAFAAPSSFGFGDVKLGAILGAYLGWVGWLEVFYGIFAGFVVGTVVALGLLALGRAGRKSAIPFGPMLIVGALGFLALHATGVVRG
jgi:leader peptidase (prepilin peptidase) / N-methyltransferase